MELKIRRHATLSENGKSARAVGRGDLRYMKGMNPNAHLGRCIVVGQPLVAIPPTSTAATGSLHDDTTALRVADRRPQFDDRAEEKAGAI